MTEVTEEEKGRQSVPEGAIGKLESDPNNPELKTGTLSLEFILSSDGFFFNDRQKALDHEEALRERSKPPGR